MHGHTDICAQTHTHMHSDTHTYTVTQTHMYTHSLTYSTIKNGVSLKLSLRKKVHKMNVLYL